MAIKRLIKKEELKNSPKTILRKLLKLLVKKGLLTQEELKELK